MSSGEYDQANQRCGEMIAKIRQPVESPERSSSSLVDVVCIDAARLPIQLWYSFLEQSLSFLDQQSNCVTTHSSPAYPESMLTLHIFCCCRRSPLAHTEARRIR
jgi:hypothetical protein